MLSHEAAMLLPSVLEKNQQFSLDFLALSGLQMPTRQPSLPERRVSVDENDGKAAVKKGCQKQPLNTRVHKVKCGDKLTSLAALCDTTPSVLKNLNKLASDFLYPNQILFLPVIGSCSSPAHGDSASSNGDASSDSDFHSSYSCEEDRAISGSSSKKSSISSSDGEHKTWSPPTRRATFDKGYAEAFRYRSVGASPLSADSQRYIRLSSSYIVPEKDETVKGTLLVTPNAAMFDPYVSDPLVIERGVEEFGMIAKMDTIVSAAIYKDSKAMHNLQRLKLDPTAKKPSIYHLSSLGCNEDRQGDSTYNTETMESTAGQPCLCRSLEERQEYSHGDSPEAGATKVVFDLMDDEVDENEEPVGQQATDCSMKTVRFQRNQVRPCTGERESCDGGLLNLSYESKHEHSSNSLTASDNPSNNFYIDSKCGKFAPDSSASLHKCFENHCHTCSEPYTIFNNKAKCPLYIKAGVGREEKPHLFKPICDLVASANSLDSVCQPFYLCFQVGERLEQCRITDTCPIEAYTKKRKRPEYWFTIPSDLVDSLYNFFVQWRPELYGEEITDPAILCSKGFVSIPESSVSRISSSIPRSPMVRQLSHAKLVKNWEVLSVDEMARRQSLLDIQKYVPFPDMTSSSLLLSDEHIKKLTAVLPARVEGHQWRLAYCTEEHGFSLSTLYRNMSKGDSATVLVIQDENDAVFGAFSSASIQHREHFYGNGECFLFSLVDGFKMYRWTGKNMFCVRGDLQGLTLGTGSATCGLWLDAALYHGRTQHCDTFDNEPLTGAQEDFIIKGMEVWSLMD
ncbi:nuclear receptor coactivator 7-like [Watersipora subatra]|uniref:nuclear receptor coactivator 7-like n=1 Tax=Watersipora subatra TaxID=2589382 RepID=UPI00355C4600